MTRNLTMEGCAESDSIRSGRWGTDAEPPAESSQGPRTRPLRSRLLPWLLIASTLGGSLWGYFGSGQPGHVSATTPTARQWLPTTADDEPLRQRGEAIYKAACADCHGEQGEGVAGAYASPLLGDETLSQLARVIDETMPEGAPEDCQGEDAVAVATYIYQAFYSEDAQLRQRPPRTTFSRLTANQLRQSYADLYAVMAGGVTWSNPERGVHGLYFDGEHWNNEQKKLDRIDPTLDFDFGQTGPGGDIQANKFYIHWTGGLKIDHSGEYEIVVRCSTSFMFYLGRHDRVFFDNHVQSGEQIEFRKSIYLTAGRVYPFKLEMRQRERKTETPPAIVQLAWVPPGGVQQPIPTFHLIPGWLPAAFSLQTVLPPDDQTYGYERGILVNPQWDQATTAAALEFADMAAAELWPSFQTDYAKQNPEPTHPRAALSEFLTRILQRAFRFQFTDDDRHRYVETAIATTEDDLMAIKKALLLGLKSPYFLYPATSDGRATPSQQIANRMALTLMDSLPANEPFDQLANRSEVSADEIRSLVWGHWNDFRVQAKYRSLIYQWLHLDPAKDLRRNEEVFPGFDADLVQDLRQSFDLSISELLMDSQGDHRRLLTADRYFATPALRRYYGGTWEFDSNQPAIGHFQPTVADHQRRGLLTHPFFASHLSYQNATSPIHRGVVLYRYILGRTLRPPADDFAPLSPDLHPQLTTRERVELQTSPESCQVCHQKINGLGFALETLDPTGRFRTEDQGKAINDQGRYVDRAGKSLEFGGVQDLADYLKDSPDLQRAFVNRLFQHFTKQPIAAYGPDQLARLTESFVNSGFSLPNLLVEMTVIAAQPPELAK